MSDGKDNNVIYCAITRRNNYGDVVVTALADDGHVVAGHYSSSVPFAMHDIGYTSKLKHNIYDEKYPNGWDIEWVEDPNNHEGWGIATKLNHELHKARNQAD